MSDFANLGDAGARLADPLRVALADVGDPLVLAVQPNGVPVAIGLRSRWAVEVRGLVTERSADGVLVRAPADLAGRDVVVVDDGVETGTLARAAAGALRAVGVASLTLAVPVCPREIQVDLERRYDRIVAVVRPIARRRLDWHYDDFDTIDEPAALALLATLPPALPDRSAPPLP